MGRYSIKELERLSGIKAHTIRIWEKRHGLVHPERTATNIRFYSDDDLKKIINVSVLNNNGLKISRIAELTTEEISKKVYELTDSKSAFEVYINQMSIAMVDLDEEPFDRLISKLALKYGLERTITDIVYPFLERIGILWQTGNITPAQEHFISNLVRQKIIVAIDSLPLPPKNSKRVVLFLPEYELHEIGLLFCHYLVRKEGFRTYYLGQAVPYVDLKKVLEIHHPDVLITMVITERDPKEIQQYIDTLAADYSKTVILCAGSAIAKMALRFPSNFHLVDKALSVKTFLNRNF